MKLSLCVIAVFKISMVLSFFNYNYAQTEWTIILSNDQLKDEAIRVSLEDLKNTGEAFGFVFSVIGEQIKSFDNAVIVGDTARNQATANLAKTRKIQLAGVADPQGYEIITTDIDGGKAIVVAGGSIIGDVYGLYWIWDRLRVFKKLPDINVKREPALKIRYTRVPVKSKADIKRALRYGLNLVYGENPLALIPWDAEPERTENEKNREKTRELAEYAHALHMKFLSFGTDFTYHPSLLKKLGATLSPADPCFWDAVQVKYRKLLQAIPELDGVATFTGEEQRYWGNYQTFDMMHEGSDCDWSLEKRYRTFVKKVANVVVGEFDKIYHHRTWITNAYEQQSRPEVYKKIFSDDVPAKNLYLIPSFTQHDRWWHQDYNPTFNLTPHNMLVVLEPMNYHESSRSNIFPTFPGQYFQAGLQSILDVKHSNLKGASFDLHAVDDFKTSSVTAYTVFRLEWDYHGDLYGRFNSLPHIRVGTFPAQGYTCIDNGKEHIEFLRKLYLRCKPWIPETLFYLDHGFETAKKMVDKYQSVKSLIEDENLSREVENSLEMTRLLIKTNNLYVKTFFAYFQYRENPTIENKNRLSNHFTKLGNTHTEFSQRRGFGYHLFGVDQFLKNAAQALEDLTKAEELLVNSPDRQDIENIIANQQKKYARLLKESEKDVVKILHWEGRVDGRDILKIKGNNLEVEHLRWDPIYFNDYTFFNALPPKAVTVIPKDIESRPMHPFILEQPCKENKYTVKIYLYDVPGGAGWCKFDLYYLPKKPVELGLEIPWCK